jgi:diguanylate cyclase (GGDEF)-like protein/PAS domain S-box-containing protein
VGVSCRVTRSKAIAIGALACLAWASLPAAAESSVDLSHKRVLLLYSYHPTFASSDAILRGVRSVFDEHKLTLHIEFMDSKRLLDKVSKANFLRMFSYKLAKRPRYDLVMVSDDNALDLVLAHRAQLFPRTPIVFLAVNDVQKAIKMDHNPWVTGVVEALSPERTVVMMRSLQPQLGHVVVVADATPSGKADLVTVKRLPEEFPGIDFEFLSLGDMSWADLAKRLGTLRRGRRTAVLRLVAFRDKEGTAFDHKEAVSLMMKSSAAPVYGLRATDVRAGAVGGVVVSHRDQGREAALIAEKVLQGTPISSVKVLRESPNRPIFNYLGLKRFNISLTHLPPGSLILNKPADFVEQYALLGGVAFVVILLLAAFSSYLMWQILARRRTEAALAKRAQRFEGLVRTSAKVAGTIEAEDTLTGIAKEAANLLGLEGGGFRLLVNDELVVAGRYGLAQQVMQRHTLKVGESLTGLVAREGRTIAVPDLQTDDRLHPDHKWAAISQEIVSYLGTPLRYRGKLIGVLNVYGKERHLFDDEEIVLLQAFADHAAIAIEKARLYTKTKRHAEELGNEIAERKQAEEALKSSEERFRNLIEGSIQGIFIHRDFKPLFVNQAFANILGYESADELLASIESIEDHHAPHERARLRGYKDARLRGEAAPIRYEYDALRKDGSLVTLQNFVRVINWNGERAIQSTVIDVTEARTLSEQLAHQANHDALTGLSNRHAFEERLQQLLETARREKIEHVLCYLDLDQFKIINDTCGHTAGDELLRQLGGWLQHEVRGPDALARLGGDEFGILLERCSVEQAARVTAALQRAIERFRFQWEEKSFNIGVSIGVVSINDASEDMAGVLRMADAACYAAKDAGRNRVHVYREDDTELAKRRGEMHWVGAINQALEQNRFLLYCQPFIPLGRRGDEREGYELLIRLLTEDGAIIEPGAFLPAADRYNISAKLDRWLVASAFEWLSRRPQYLERVLMCSINLSGSSIGDEKFLKFIVRQFAENDIPSEKICFEITETMAIANLASATRLIKALRELGCRFALDDFGSGLSSFAYLKNLPVDFLKIDGMFVRGMVEDPIDFAMVKSINDMGHVMGKKTIAEFAENDAILASLRKLGVDYAQGYGIGVPRPIEEMADAAQVAMGGATATIIRRAGDGHKK